MKLDLIIPIYNDEKQINKFYEGAKETLKNIKHNFIFIDNSSTDDSLNILKKLQKSDDDHIKILCLSKQTEIDNIFHTGLKYSCGDVVCTMKIDDDLTYILKMYKFLNENKEYDCICNCNKDIKNNIFRKLAVNITKKYTKISYIDEMAHLKMIRKNMIPSIIELSNRINYSNAIFSLVGFNIYYDNTYIGKVEKDSLTNYIFSYCSHPLKFIINIGLLILGISLIYLIYMLVFSLNKVSLIIYLILLLSGLQVTFIGFLTNYITNFNYKNKNTRSIIKNVIGFDENYL